MKTLTDIEIIIKLINPKLIKLLNLQIHEMKQE